MLRIEEIQLLINVPSDSTDRVYLITNKPSTYPNVSCQTMQMEIKCAKGTGLKYIKDNFRNDPLFPATAIVTDGTKGTREVISLFEE